MLAVSSLSDFNHGDRSLLKLPFIYEEDALSHSVLIKRVLEGSLYTNDRLGYPYNGDFYDYPMADWGSLVIIKTIGYFSNNEHVSVFNIFILLSFPVTFIASFYCLRSFTINPLLSSLGALVFTFIPFHYYRFNHLFYQWYFVIPIYVYIGKQLYSGLGRPNVKRQVISSVFLLLLASSFGAYYSVFGCIVISASSFIAWLKYRSASLLYKGAFLIGVISLGVVVNIAPTLAYKVQHGPNKEVAQRNPAHAERYGMKLIQLLLPHPEHKNKMFREITQYYNRTFPLVNENSSSSLGIFGSIGLCLIGFSIALKIANVEVDDNITLLSFITLVLFLFGTIGGMGSIFANVISPLIRSWNRISIFIGFTSIAVMFLYIQLHIESFKYTFIRTSIYVVLSLITILLIYYDQMKPFAADYIEKTHSEYSMDQSFIASIEKVLPKGGAVYQLPYMSWPEVPAKYDLETYGLAIGFLHSSELKWSYGGMKGRDGDLSLRKIAYKSIPEQIKEIRRLGFEGIYVDRRGYHDNAKEVVDEISNFLGSPPILQRKDGAIVFFKLRTPYR